MTTKQETLIHIKKAHILDIDQILRIENMSFIYSWTKKEFYTYDNLPETNIQVLVDMANEKKILGYVCYSVRKNLIVIDNLAIHPNMLRLGYGKTFIKKIQDLSSEYNCNIYLGVRESNLIAHKFFKSCGFEAITIWKDFIQIGLMEDLYIFCWGTKGTKQEKTDEIEESEVLNKCQWTI